jgi:hypothetical protein
MEGPVDVSPGGYQFVGLSADTDYRIIVVAQNGAGYSTREISRITNWTGSPVWARSVVEGPASSFFYAVAAGDDGIYAAGSIKDNQTYDFGNGVTVNGSIGFYSSNGVLVKYDLNGRAQWARAPVNGSSWSIFRAVAIGTDGIYVAGNIGDYGTIDFGNGVTAQGAGSLSNILLIKYDTNGTAQWARSMVSGSGYSYYLSMALGNDGIYAAGCIDTRSTFDFGNSVTATGLCVSTNAVVVKYDLNGAPQWARTILAGPSASLFRSVAVGNDGVYAAGLIWSTGTYNFGDGTTVMTNCSCQNTALVKYGFDGTALWARTAESASTDSQLNAVSAGGDGIYAAGYITGTAQYDFGNSATVAGNNSGINIVLLKYGPDGSAQWARSVTAGPDISEYNSLAAGSDGIYAVGYVNGGGTFGFGGTVQAAGSYGAGKNYILVKYDMTGNPLWARSVTNGRGESILSSLSVTNSGVYSAGYITTNFLFDLGDCVTLAGTNYRENLIIVKYQ